MTAGRSVGSWSARRERRPASCWHSPTAMSNARVVGRQHAGRVGFFLRVDDFDTAHSRMTAAGVRFATEPRDEPYGRVAVWLDIAGNRWDLLGPVG